MNISSLTRRTLLSTGLSTGLAGAALLLPLRSRAALAEACTLVPEQALGPYYLEDELVRGDIREGRPGVPLELKFQVLDLATCRPLANAAVDIWHCDAGGTYSGFGAAASETETFLRGIQLTDEGGVARFQTIFPGCYPGRTNHIHFRVRTEGAVAGETYRGGHVAHTGQVFFPEDITIGLMKTGAYAGNAGGRMTQAEDGIFTGQGGRASTAKLTQAADPSQGFEALLVAAVDAGTAG